MFVLFAASHICKADPGNANQAIIIFGVVPKSDPIYRIYAFDASSTDTIDTNNRILDCYQNGTVATNPNQDRIPFTITVDFTASSGHECGVHVVRRRTQMDDF